MRILKIEMDRDVLTPGGELDVRNEVSVRLENGEYELETVYDVDAPYRDRNTQEFRIETVSLGDEENFDLGYFGDFSDSTESADPGSGDVAVNYLPGRRKAFQRTYDSGSASNYASSEFLSDLFKLDEQRVFSDLFWDQVGELPVHQEGQEPVTAEEFISWVDQLPRQAYEYLIDSFDMMDDIFDEEVVETRDFSDSLKASFGMLSEKLEEEQGYEDVPSGQELYELFRDIRGFKPVSDDETYSIGYGREIAQNMEEFVLKARNEIDLQPNDVHDVGIGQENVVLEDDSDEATNPLLRRGVKSVEGIITAGDGRELRQFLRWDVDDR
jgi:hypothetical protein